MEGLLLDLRFALRSLAKNPGYSLVIIVTLALGIGANTAIFSVVDGVLLGRLPYEHGERIVRLRQEAQGAGNQGMGFSPPEIVDYRERAAALDAVEEYHSMPFTFLGRKEPERLQTGVVSAGFFEMFGVEPLLGRTFLPGEDEPGDDPVLVLSYDYWNREMGGDLGVLGSTFEMNDRIHTVVGVLPPLPPYPDDNAIFMPASSCPFRASVRENRQGRMLSAFARLEPQIDEGRAAQDLDRLTSAMASDHPETYPENSEYRATFEPLREELTQRARPTFLLLLAAVALVLLIVCANVANLTLARRLHRERELAVRTALGADRGRLVRQLLTESTLLALLGGVLGMVLARSLLSLLVDFASRFTPRAHEVQLDLKILLFTLVLSLLTGIAFGLAPALARRRNPARALREGGDRGATSGRGLQSALVVSQVAISFILLIAAGLTLRSFLTLTRVDPGFRAENVLTLTVDLNWSKYSNPQQYRDFYQPLLSDLQSLPGVTRAAIGRTVPLGVANPFQRSFQVEGMEVADPTLQPRADVRVVSPDYFDTLGIRHLGGRLFSEFDHEEAQAAIVVSQGMAQRNWGAEDPVGRRISFDQGQTWLTVVGVVGDVKQYGYDQAANDEIYIPFLQFPLRRMSLMVQTQVEPATMVRQVREAVYRQDPEQPVAHVRTLNELRTDSLASRRLTTMLLGLFGGLALLVTASGLGGLLAFSVSQRTREIGLRMALGARRGKVLRMILVQGLSLVALGLALGAFGAFALGRYVESLLYGVAPNDLITFLAVALGLGLAASIAALGPALRATSIDPMNALRSD